MFAAIVLKRRWPNDRFVAGPHGPDDPGGLVGHGEGNEPGRFALEQAAHPVDSGGVAILARRTTDVAPTRSSFLR